MPDNIIVYWRDNASQVINQRGRHKGKLGLSQRFSVAIDEATYPDERLNTLVTAGGLEQEGA